MSKSEEYLYHCAGCKKDDKEYPDKKQECEECGGTGLEDENGFQDDCWKCGGRGRYKLHCRPIKYHMWARQDAYGIYTGLYCDKCFKDNYPFRKDRYFDPAYAGERLEPEE